MAIQKEYLGFMGKAYVRTYSDLPEYGVMREGIIYIEAVDPAELHREYEEVYIGPQEETPEGPDNSDILEVPNDQVPIQDSSQNPQ